MTSKRGMISLEQTDSARCWESSRPRAVLTMASKEAPHHHQRRHSQGLKKKRQHFSLLRELVLADLLTLGNSSCGFLSILYAISHAQSTRSSDAYMASGLLFLSLLFDVLDGKIARMFTKSRIGQDLDSLADIISFGVAPGVLGYCMGLNATLDVIVLVVFVNCGVLRLARFNSSLEETSVDGKVAFFEGTPIPSTVFITLVLVVGLYHGHSQGPHTLSTVFGVPFHVISCFLVI